MFCNNFLFFILFVSNIRVYAYISTTSCHQKLRGIFVIILFIIQYFLNASLLFSRPLQPHHAVCSISFYCHLSFLFMWNWFFALLFFFFFLLFVLICMCSAMYNVQVDILIKSSHHICNHTVFCVITFNIYTIHTLPTIVFGIRIFFSTSIILCIYVCTYQLYIL